MASDAAAGRLVSKEELALHSGDNGGPVWLAVQGTVFDVSEGRAFYGPGGPYAPFAGKECSRALALMQISEAECSDRIDDLTPQQLKTMQDWIAKFRTKYPVVGQVRA